MINVVGSTPSPATPLPPNLPGDLPTDLGQTPAAGDQPTPNSEVAGSTPTPPQKKSKLPGKYILAGALLLLLVIGSGVGLYLVKIQQDLRQQAKVYEPCGPTDILCIEPRVCDPAQQKCVLPPGKCITNADCSIGQSCQNNNCTTQVTQPAPSGGCGSGSAAQCQGKDPGDRCGNNAPFGTCRALSDGDCVCRTSEGPTPTPTHTPTPTLTPTLTVTPTPFCAQIAGSCIGKNSSCVEFADSCERDELCVSPFQDCQEPTPTPEGDGTGGGGGDTNVIASADSSSNAEANVNIGGTTTGTTTTGGQPILPSELPQTGPEDWLKYLQIGLGVLGAGALLLLFL